MWASEGRVLVLGNQAQRKSRSMTVSSAPASPGHVPATSSDSARCGALTNEFFVWAARKGAEANPAQPAQGVGRRKQHGGNRGVRTSGSRRLQNDVTGRRDGPNHWRLGALAWASGMEPYRLKRAGSGHLDNGRSTPAGAALVSSPRFGADFGPAQGSSRVGPFSS